MSHYYDDPEFTYTEYWQGRDYEHLSELQAISKLLENKKFKSGVDIGGGYGRIVPHLSRYCQKLTLVEPSAKQRSLAKKYLHDIREVVIASGTSNRTKLKPGQYDLVTLVRVMHHLPDPNSTFKEIHRLLKPQGLAIIEFANALNFKSRVTSFLAGKPILPTPIERRSAKNIQRDSIAFVNHHPIYIRKLLSRYGLQPTRVLSVSNLRFPLVKKLLPLSWLLVLEQIGQKLLSWAYFGPSIFMLVEKVDNT